MGQHIRGERHAWRVGIGVVLLLFWEAAVGVPVARAADQEDFTTLASETADVDLDKQPEIVSLLAERQILSVVVQQGPKERMETIWLNGLEHDARQSNPKFEVRDLNQDKIPEIVIIYTNFDVRQITVIAWQKKDYLIKKEDFKVIFNDSGALVRVADFNHDGLDEIEVANVSGLNGSLPDNLIHLFDTVTYAWDTRSRSYNGVEDRLEDRAAPANYPKLVAELEKNQDWYGLVDHFELLRERATAKNADTSLAGILDKLKVPAALAYYQLGRFEEATTIFGEVLSLEASSTTVSFQEKIRAFYLTVLAARSKEVTLPGDYPDEYPEIGILLAETLARLGQRTETVAFIDWLTKEYGSYLSDQDREQLEQIKAGAR